MAKLRDNVRYCKGIGEQRANTLHKLGIDTLEDLLRWFPRDYQDRSKIRDLATMEDGETACVLARVVTVPVLSYVRAGMNLVKFRIADDSGSADVVYFNQPYVKKQILSGQERYFFGRFRRDGGYLQIQNPITERMEQAGLVTGRIVPVYSLTAGITQKALQTAVTAALNGLEEPLPDLLPPGMEERYGLESAQEAYRHIHFPETMEQAGNARRRLVFEELFTLACALGSLKGQRKIRPGIQIRIPHLEEFTKTLSYQLTGAQLRAAQDALGDMSSGQGMNRLIQGDVGSGKTVVAAICIWAACRSGLQCAFMAPTELLARQHQGTMEALLGPMGIHTVLLTGSLGAAAKRQALSDIRSGTANLVIGTHALLSAGVEYSRLGLVITDEQHRFGVSQRAALAEKADSPHILVMSATPIPRTLALMIYGDLDVSVIDELPPGRQTVDTFAVKENMRQRVRKFVEKLVGEGRQVYIVCPMIGDDDQRTADLQSAKELYEELRCRVFPHLRLEILHGKMKGTEKDRVMRAFASGEVDILVSTTVVEVGVDVPNAALMVVENEERFGLSQLHQLRGRVGRGKHKSYCILMQGSDGGDAEARLNVMVKCSNGFRIAEEDLKLRGPGDFFGQRQHGLPELQIADLASSLDVLKWAQEEATGLLAVDPDLKTCPVLRDRVRKMLESQLGA